LSLFWPGEHLPDPFRSGFPAPGPSVIAADATPLTPSAEHDASTTMRFFTFHLTFRRDWGICAAGRNDAVAAGHVIEGDF